MFDSKIKIGKFREDDLKNKMLAQKNPTSQLNLKIILEVGSWFQIFTKAQTHH